jgi:hypothetical protein
MLQKECNDLAIITDRIRALRLAPTREEGK